MACFNCLYFKICIDALTDKSQYCNGTIGDKNMPDDFWTEEKKKEYENLHKKYIDMMNKYCIEWCAECGFFTPDNKCMIHDNVFKGFYNE